MQAASTEYHQNKIRREIKLGFLTRYRLQVELERARKTDTQGEQASQTAATTRKCTYAVQTEEAQ